MKEKENLRSTLIMVAFGIFVGVAISFCISAIVAPSEEQVSIQEEEMEEIGVYYPDGNTIGGNRILKIHDNKDNVTCWLAFSGISCIPDHMLSP